jgi:hypothetical protein
MRHNRSVHGTETERFMEIIGKQFGATIADNVRFLCSSDSEAIIQACRLHPEIYTLKLAALVCDASEMDQLDDSALAEWRKTVDDLDVKNAPVKVPSDLLEATQEMLAYLQNATNYCDTTLALT